MTLRARGGVGSTLVALLASLLAIGFTGAAAPGHSSSSYSRSAGSAPATQRDTPGLSVLRDGVWVHWWDASTAPLHWRGESPIVSRAIAWQPTADAGAEWGELRLSGAGEAWRIRVIVVRIDPRRTRVRLDTAFDGSIARAAWSTDHAPVDALVAVNAGQFSGSLPWGWVVMNGHQFLPAGQGPLVTSIVIDTAGAIDLVQSGSAPSARSINRVADAFQSYPTLLRDDGMVPDALRPARATSALDIEHRDARVAIGRVRDGRILLAITRFDALDGLLDYVPFGLTVPEMAAVMGALGCADAVMLDGGISSQLMIRTRSGERRQWRGVRRVPMGLLVLPRH